MHRLQAALLLAFSFHIAAAPVADNDPAPDASRRGTLRYEKGRTQDGYNLVEADAESPECRIYTMEGKYVHSLPGELCGFLADGRLLTALTDDKFVLFDKNQKPVWTKNMRVHHDFDVNTQRGELAFLRKLPRVDKAGRDMRLDAVEVTDLDGQRRFVWKTHEQKTEMSRAFGYPVALYKSYNDKWALSHLNSVQIIPSGNPANRIKGFEPGNLLITCFHHSRLFVVDRKGKIVWTHVVSGGSLADRRGAHSAKLSPRGTIVFFKNRDLDTAPGGPNNSSIVEVDAATGKEKVIYKAAQPGRFFADFYGTVSELANGNFLITHIAQGGSAFEIDAKGKIVWEWMTPLNGADGKPVKIYRVSRVSRKLIEGYLRSVGVNPR